MKEDLFRSLVKAISFVCLSCHSDGHGVCFEVFPIVIGFVLSSLLYPLLIIWRSTT